MRGNHMHAALPFLSNMGILDLVCIILLVVAALWGFIRGFRKGTIRTLAFYAGIAAGYFLGETLAKAFMNMPIENNVFYNLYLPKLPDSEAFMTNINGLSYEAQRSAISAGLTELHFPKFFQGFLITRASVLDGNVQQAVCSSFTYVTILALCFLALFLVAYFFVRLILGKVTEVAFGEDGKGFLGRIAGLIRQVVVMSMFIIGGMMVMVLVSNLMLRFDKTTISDFLSEDLQLTDGSYFSLGRIFYNTASQIMSWVGLK